MADLFAIPPEVSHVLLFFVSACFAYSQIVWFSRKPSAWRFTTMCLFTFKAAYFFFIGSVFWFDWFDPGLYGFGVFVFGMVEFAAWIHWLNLPTSGPEAVAPLKDG